MSLQMKKRICKRGLIEYTADCDVDCPIASISPCSVEKEMRTSYAVAQAKRIKTEELNYQAFNVKNDLSAADISCLPFLGKYKTMALSPGSEDYATSIVELVVATKDSPYHSSGIRDRTKEAQGIFHSYQEYSSMLTCSKNFYEVVFKPPSSDRAQFHKITHGQSSTADPRTTASSPSSITSDECDKDLLELPARLKIPNETYFLSHTSNNEKLLNFITSSVKQSAKVLTIEEALDCTKSARLLIESAPSMMIVHANAAFYQLTNMSGENVVGNCLTEIIQVYLSEQSTTQATVSIKGNSFALATYPIKCNSEIIYYCLEIAKMNACPSSPPEESQLELVG